MQRAVNVSAAYSGGNGPNLQPARGAGPQLEGVHLTPDLKPYVVIRSRLGRAHRAERDLPLPVQAAELALPQRLDEIADRFETILVLVHTAIQHVPGDLQLGDGPFGINGGIDPGGHRS